MSHEDEYHLRKGGYFYRPNAQGYTPSELEAGRYSKEEAEKYVSASSGEVSMVKAQAHLSPKTQGVLEDILDDLKRAQKRLQLGGMQSYDNHLYSAIKKLTALSPAKTPEDVQGALREIIEIYAGMEGFIPETCPEGYLQQILKKIVGVASAALTNAGVK